MKIIERRSKERTKEPEIEDEKRQQMKPKKFKISAAPP